ncbi:glycoside hydrolase family 18 protein [Ganoderma leucocontextum]|nr:glycoside hydrolase family 18 protein [Ganoderma leucocontextum]
MFASVFRHLSAFVAVLLALQLAAVVAAPLEEHDLEALATPPSPRFVVYADSYQPGVTGPPAVSALKGFNTYIMSFWLTAGPWDKAYEWTTLSASDRASVKSKYHAAGIKLMVAAFGSTDVPTTANADPVTTANNLASFVKTYGLDGVDVDYEDFGAMDAGTAENWLITFTRQLRAKLPASSNYIITHAPVAPWFTPTHYPGGGYLRVHKAVGGLIDWYNVQFYNQGPTEYTTCAGLLTTSSATWPKTALFQIIASGVAGHKVVVGKPATVADATNGYVDASTLATCIGEAKGKGWRGGVMSWQYPHADATWIRTVRSKAWPV